MSGLTEAERRLYEAIEHTEDLQGLAWRVEQTVLAHEKALRESIAQDMEREGRRMAQAREGWPPVALKFANIARGGAR